MNITDLRRELNDEPMPEPLDPSVLVSHARERGTRRTRRLLVTVSTLVVVALGLTTAVRAGWLADGNRSYIAGQPSATSSTSSAPVEPTSAPTGAAIVVTTSPNGGVATVTPGGTIPATGVIPAVPYVAIGEAPAVRTIPDNTWVEVVAGTWVATWKTNVVRTYVEGSRPTKTPQAACEANDGLFDCRGTIHNTNRDSSFSGYQATGADALTVVSSSFEGAPMSTKAQVPDGATYWGVCWRLEGIPGWTFTVWTMPTISQGTVTIGPSGIVFPSESNPPLTSPILTIYDAAGSLIGKYQGPG